MIDLSTFRDPTYNQPLVDVEINGNSFVLINSEGWKFQVTLPKLKETIEVADKLEKRIGYYQLLIDADAQTKDTQLARQYIDIAKRHLQLYRGIYIPSLEDAAKPALKRPEPPKVHKPLPEPAGVSEKGQFSLF